VVAIFAAAMSAGCPLLLTLDEHVSSGSPDGSVGIDAGDGASALEASSLEASRNDATPDGWCVHHAPPTALFCDDFDNGSLGYGWLAHDENDGTIAIRVGSDASVPYFLVAEGPLDGSPGAYVHQRIHAGSPGASVRQCVLEFNFRIDSLEAPRATLWVATLGIGDDLSRYLLVALDKNGALRGEDHSRDGGIGFASMDAAVALSQWHHVSIGLTKIDADGGTARAQLFLNDGGLGEISTVIPLPLSTTSGTLGIASFANTGAVRIAYDNAVLRAE